MDDYKIQQCLLDPLEKTVFPVLVGNLFQEGTRVKENCSMNLISVFEKSGV